MAATGAGSTGAAARTGPVSPAAGGEGTSAASRRGGWTAAGVCLGRRCAAPRGVGRAVRAGRCSTAPRGGRGAATTAHIGRGGEEDVTGFWHCVLSTEALQGCQVTVGLRGKQMCGWQNGVAAVFIPTLHTAKP